MYFLDDIRLSIQTSFLQWNQILAHSFSLQKLDEVLFHCDIAVQLLDHFSQETSPGPLNIPNRLADSLLGFRIRVPSREIEVSQGDIGKLGAT